MSELKELFDMVTNKTEPESSAWQEQERRQRKRTGRRRAAAFTAAAAIVVGAVVAALLAHARGEGQPMQSSPPPAVFSASASLVAVDVATGAQAQVLSDIASFRPAVSPDGMQIAFVRTVEGKEQLFVANIDGTDPQQLTGLKGQPGCGCGAFDPTWSPDGEQLAYSGTNVFGNQGIYVMTIATGEVDLLTHEIGDAFEVTPDWAPGGRQIAYAGGSWQEEPPGSGQIYAIPVKGSRSASLLADQAGAVDPSWDPTGSSIVYTANVKGGTALFTTSINNTQPPRRLTDGADDGSPTWSPDGTRIAFVRGTDIAILTVATGAVQTFGTGGDPEWSADGTALYVWQS